MSRPLALLFDLDGTLLDTMELILASARHAFAGRERAPTDAEWLAGVGTPLQAQLRAYALDEADLEALTRRYRAHQVEHHDRLTRCFDDVPATLAVLQARGHPMAVVTSKATAIARRGLAFTGIERFFPVVIGADETMRHKPDPEPVRLALDRLGYAPSDALFVGDSTHDVLAGRAAGVRTVAACWGPVARAELEAAGADHLLGCLAELPGLVERLG
ncbi:MAG TPA: HAD-IA family hydrolase [Gemmatimonadaceae bacterium]|nr:HAD-IA family hydrolase [Gemmatimonadaceae bacterium]